MSAGPFAAMIAGRRPLLLDGAMGTELQRRGVDIGLPLWSAHAVADSPEVVLHIHTDYIEAGADIITTNTFRTTSRTYFRAGLPDHSEAMTRRAVELARTARERIPHRHVLVAGSLAPLEDCYRPDRVPPDHELRAEHNEQASRLAEAGVDVLLLETFGTIREARAACAAAAATGREVLMSFLCTPSGTLYSGESLEDAVAAVMPLGPAALCINCVSARHSETPFAILRDAVRRHTPAGNTQAAQEELPLGIYANAGFAGMERSTTLLLDVGPDEYAAFARSWIRAGAALVGGCCGTTPDHIRKLA